MKYLVLILDGAAGWPLPELGGATTLAAADTPNLDVLAREGMVGLAQTVPEGVEPSSAAACTSILGYDPVENYVGRGAIEAASMGISLAPDEVALRMNLVAVDDGVMASYSCGHITTEESRAIVADLALELGDDTFTFCPGVAYRHILVVKGHPELMELAYTPPHDISDKSIAGHMPRGRGAELLLDLMARAREVLTASPANRARAVRGEVAATEIWPFWPGMAPGELQPFSALRGKKAALTSGVDLLNGLAVLFGFERLDIPGVSDGSDNDYVAQIEGGLAALDDHDVVIVHVESPDEEGHAGDRDGKIAAIEAIDRLMVSKIREYPGDLRVLCMPDHPTPIELKTHVGEPVPFVLSGPGVAYSGADSYDEAAASAGEIRIDPGHKVMDLLLG
ncbi:MAG: cofactor-independent phosphoglycerate mutase [Coriobacteriia bacterium]|nr:cofactor-independent phosphoglycerate mutase [Coriobacteriia bacterium]